MKSEELENPANVKVDYMGKDIPIIADEAYKSYTGTATLVFTGLLVKIIPGDAGNR